MKWLVLVLFALLPLQWFSVASTPLGQGRLHHLVIFMFAAILLSRYRMRAHAPALRTARGFVLANLYLLSAWAVIDLYNGKQPFGAVQELLYLVAFVAIATFFYRVANGSEDGAAQALKWAATVTCLAVLIGFSVAMSVNGVNALAVFGRAVSAADPEILQREVFRSSFAGFGLEDEMVRGNLRHEIFGSVLFSMLVSTWAMRFARPSTHIQRIAYRASMLTGAVLLALSLSRSILIAAAAWPLIALVTAAASGRLSLRQVAAVAISAMGVAALMLSGFGQVLWNRFTEDTTGYDARAGNYSGAFDALQDHWLTGGFQTFGMNVSTHNFVLDSWLRGGIFTAIPAAVLVLLLVFVWARLIWTLHRAPDWMVPVTAALALPVVRLGTSGGGLIPPVEWVVLAFVFGILTFRAYHPARPGEPVVPVTTSA